MTINVIGAGLAGSEAAWQCAKMGAKVRLYEMKPEKKTPAHSADTFCELCCSNSLRAEGLKNAVGLLKEELRRCGSIVMKCADETSVPAGGCLAVDRNAFSEAVTRALCDNPDIEIIGGEVKSLDFEDTTIIASGPLTSDSLAESIRDFFGGEQLHFFDAEAPIVTADSIDMNKAYLASRYGKGTADYINCPMTKAEYDAFYDALVSAETAVLHDFDNRIFEGCMPVEIMASRGRETLAFGPMKPVGLENPATGEMPYAVVQLRRDNHAGSLYNIVGFQTHLTFPEQRRVFRMIPGLENAEFARYGVMHRNTFLDSPRLLTETYETRKKKGLYFAGQMTGVEGYVESCASGLVAGLNAATGNRFVFPPTTALGALAHYISDHRVIDFQPMNINYGLMTPPPLEPGKKKVRKSDRKEIAAAFALSQVEKIISGDAYENSN